MNIEQQNKEPQNHQGAISIFDIPCWIFCGLKETPGRTQRSNVGGQGKPDLRLLTSVMDVFKGLSD